MSQVATRRCAIYTRKSHEEGLDQAFNSLDAQREAGLDFIRSQKHEGWQAIETQYDDGGYSGGNIQRPAIQQLIEDIKHGSIDVVVVYKVDRLSRSLHDFAQLMKLFDEHQVCFVSVTQQFNTTTSMGRLTLNMLLSFAQFEREVTSERIRDKLAATKKKGLWVIGQPPLGYKAADKHLEILPGEAKLVNTIFRGYLENQSLLQLSEQLNAQGHTTKQWTSTRDITHGGKPLTPKYIYRVLTNPVYIGKITHNQHVWPGIHKPIIPRKLWDQVQRTIDTQHKQTRNRWSHPHLLKGKLRTSDDAAMSPSAVHRPSKIPGQKHLVRYYVSQKAIRKGYKNCPIKTINASHLDELTRALLLNHLHLHHDIDTLHTLEQQERDHWLREFIDTVYLAPDQLTIQLNIGQIETYKAQVPVELNSDKPEVNLPMCLYQPEIQRRGQQITLTLKIQIKKLDHKRILVTPDGHDLFMSENSKPKDHIVQAIGQAYYWHQELANHNGSPIKLARHLGLSKSTVHKYLPLTQLGPRVLDMALSGHLPPSMTLQDLLTAASMLDWQKQIVYLRLEQIPGRTA